MGAGGVIIIRNLKAALSVGCNKSGSVKLWHVLTATHLGMLIAGALVF